MKSKHWDRRCLKPKSKSRLAKFIADDSRCNRRLSNGETQADIARSYAVDPTTIGRLVMASHPD